MKIACIGLGIMGSRMAGHLIDWGMDVTLWNRSPERAEPLVERGGKLAPTAEEAVAGADLVLTMLSTPDVVSALMCKQGLLRSMKSGAIWADSSTVSPAFARQSAEWAGQAGVRYLGTPVAGTREPADRGELKVLVGGPTPTLEEARPALEPFSNGIVHVGEEADRGAALKILINGMLAQSMLVFSETVKLGEAMGLSHDMLLRTLANTPVIAPFVRTKTNLIAEGDYTDASFPLELMHKDLNLITETAYEVGQPSLLATVTREVYGRAVAAGRGREDFAAVHTLH